MTSEVLVQKLLHYDKDKPETLRVIKNTLEDGADPNVIFSDDGVCAMLLAAGLGVDVMSMLLQYDGDPNIQSLDGTTPLHIAASWGDVDTLRLLLHSGANVDLLDQDGKRALDLAVENGHEACSQELKVFTMLAVYEDHDDLSPKFFMYEDSDSKAKFFPSYTTNERHHGCHDDANARDKTRMNDLDKSVIEPDVLSSAYSDTVTQRVYDCLEKGQKICLDATSPTTPIITLKSLSDCSLCHTESRQNELIRQSHPHHHRNHPHHAQSQNHPRPCNFPQSSHSKDCLSCNSSSGASAYPSLGCACCGRSSSPSYSAYCSSNQDHCCFSPSHHANTNSSFPSQNCGHCCTDSVINKYSGSSHNNPTSSGHNASPFPYHDCSSHFASAETSMNTPHSSHSPNCYSHSSSIITKNHHNLYNFDQNSKFSSHYGKESCNHDRNSRFTSHSGQFTSNNAKNSINSLNHGCQRYSTNHNANEFRSTNQSKDLSPIGLIDNISAADNLTAVNKITSRISDVKINDTGSPISRFQSDIKVARTANFVLSCPDSLSQLSPEHTSNSPDDNFDTSSMDTLRSTKSSCPEYIKNKKNFTSFDSGFCPDPNKSETGCKIMSRKQNKNSRNGACAPCKNRDSMPLNSSSSSCESFSTCRSALEEDTRQAVLDNTSPTTLAIPKGRDESHHKINQNIIGRWKAPLSHWADEDLMTSDESFINPEVSKRRVDNTGKRFIQKSFPKHIDTSYIKQEISPQLGTDNDALHPHPDRCTNTREKARLSEDSIFSTVSVREYVYNDRDRGITLIERHIPSDCGSSIGRRSLDSVSSKMSVASKMSLDSQCTLIYDWRSIKTSTQPSHRSNLNNSNNNNNSDTLTITSEDEKNEDPDLKDSDKDEQVTVPMWIESLTNDEVTKELQKYGETPGPVIVSTRQVYLRRLASLESNPGLVQISRACPAYPCELRKALDGLFDWSTDLEELESQMTNSFIVSQGRQWREGTVKSSFTYLLLDPRVTDNLPFRAKELSEVEAFKCFICAIFYIGKGKRARPYCHLYEAISKMKKTGAKMGAKVKHIIDIWEDNHGVVSLHCFQSVIPVEAYTREACMLEAIGLHKVTNVKRGDFYGIACSWSMQQRRRLGVYLLKKAFAIFIAEGERQIYIPDLKS